MMDLKLFLLSVLVGMTGLAVASPTNEVNNPVELEATSVSVPPWCQDSICSTTFNGYFIACEKTGVDRLTCQKTACKKICSERNCDQCVRGCNCKDPGPETIDGPLNGRTEQANSVQTVDKTDVIPEDADLLDTRTTEDCRYLCMTPYLWVIFCCPDGQPRSNIQNCYDSCMPTCTKSHNKAACDSDCKTYCSDRAQATTPTIEPTKTSTTTTSATAVTPTSPYQACFLDCVGRCVDKPGRPDNCRNDCAQRCDYLLKTSSATTVPTSSAVAVVKKAEIVQGDCYSIIKPCVRKCAGERKECTKQCCKDLCHNNRLCYGGPTFCPCDDFKLEEREASSLAEVANLPASP